jgi:hypothetical protein
MQLDDDNVEVGVVEGSASTSEDDEPDGLGDRSANEMILLSRPDITGVLRITDLKQR